MSQTILFVFRRRGIAQRIRAKAPAFNCDLDTEMVSAPRRRKTKSKGTIRVFPYKQATPYGVCGPGNE